MINLDDGLDFDEVLQIAKALNVTKLLNPDLHGQLSAGVDSLLSIMTALQGIPFILNLLPGNLGGQLDGAIKALQLMKSLLAA